MPYRLSKNGLCVQKKEGGRWKNLKCYESHEKALKYLRALEVNVNEAVRQWVEEAGGSLDDFVNRVRGTFHKWYNDGLSWERMAWVLDVFEDHIMVKYGEKVFRVDFTINDDEAITFADTPWPVYVLRYVPAGQAQEDAVEESDGAEDSVDEALKFDIKLPIKLAEAATDRDGFYPNSVIVVEGESLNGNTYTLAALRSGVEIFDGARVVVDHESLTEARERPEGSVRNVVGKVLNPHVGKTDADQNALLGDVFISSAEEKLRTKIDEGIVGDLSIKAWGEGTEPDPGHYTVERFIEHPYTNVAVVTAGAAGGKLVSESHSNPDGESDETQPVSETEQPDDEPSVQEAPRREVRELRESDQKELAEVTAERDQLLEENTRLFRDLRYTQAETQIAEAVSGVGDLPKATLRRIAERAGTLKEAFATHGSQQTVEQFREAIDGLVEAERTYLAQITPNGAVTGLTSQGESAPVEDVLAEAFKDIVPPGQVAVAVRGRQ